MVIQNFHHQIIHPHIIVLKFEFRPLRRFLLRAQQIFGVRIIISRRITSITIPAALNFIGVAANNNFNHFLLLGYLGCFIDKDARDLKHAELRSSAMTVEMCILHCSEAGFNIAGLQVSVLLSNAM